MKTLIDLFFTNSSKKLWVVVAAVAVTLLRDRLGVSEEQLVELFKWIGAPYLAAQGAADLFKSKAIIEAAKK